MTRKKLFVCEKPMAANSLTNIINENDHIILAQGISSYKFDYQLVKFSESPYTKEKPRYKHYIKNNFDIFNTECWDNNGNRFKNTFLKKYFDFKNNEVFNKENNLKLLEEFFRQYDEIVYACDADLTGFRGFDFKFEKYFNLGKDWISFFDKLNIKITGMIINSLDEKSLNDSYKKREILKDSLFFKNLKDSYLKKDFFEYNYNLNSILFFSDALKDAGYIKNEHSKILTKNYILTIFLIKNNDHLSISNITNKMCLKNIGSSASRYVIIDDLLKMEIVEEDKNVLLDDNDNDDELKSYKYKLTKMGEKFVCNLHKKVRDPDLSIRLLKNNFTIIDDLKYDKREDAKNLSVEDFKEKYEKYLYNVFSKQKRFLRKIKRDI